MSTASSIRSIGFAATWPFLAIYFENDLGIPISVVGIIFTLFSVTSIVFSLIGGGLADFIGRKNTLISGSVISFALFISIAFIVQNRSLAIPVMALFVLSSVGGSFVFPSASALVADVTSESERTNGFVVYRILTNLGWAIGPLSGSLIIDYGIHWIFILVALCSIVQGVLVMLFVKDTRVKALPGKERTKFSIISYDHYLIVFSIGTFFLTMVSSQFSVTLPLFSSIFLHIPSSQIGYIYAVNGTIVVAGQYPITNLLRRFQEMVPMVLGTVFYSLGYLSVAFSRNLVGLMISMAIITVGENMTSPVMNSVVSKIAPHDRVARYMGFLGMVNSTGRALGPSVGSFLIAAFLFDGAYVWLFIDIFGFLAILTFIIFSVYARRTIKMGVSGTKVTEP